MTHPEILRAEKFGSLDDEAANFCSVCGERILYGFDFGFTMDGRAVCGECGERGDGGRENE